MSEAYMEEAENEIYMLQDAITGLKYILEEKNGDIKDLLDRIASLEAKLANRPVVYCARNKVTGKMLTLGGNIVLMHSVQRSAWEGVVWTTEIYTGEQS